MPSPLFLLVFIYIAFVSLGLPDSVMGVAWPAMRAALGIPLEGIGLVPIVLTVCSAVSSISSAYVNKKMGTGLVVALSCLLTAIGMFGYSLAPSFLWILVSAIPLGFGQGAVDSALNAYVAASYESRHMNWLHASWGIGATIGPLVMTQVLVCGFLWRDGYRIIAAIQGLLGLLFLVFLPLWKKADAAQADAQTENGHAENRKRISGLRRIEPWIQIVMYGLYCAAEISVGIWTASLLVEARHLDRGIAGILVSSYYGGITAGRILTGFAADRVGNRNMVRLGLVSAIAGIALFGLRLPIPATFLGLILIGLGFAPIFPCLMHETPRRFDQDTYRKVIGFQLAAAYLGGSVLPALFGLAASRWGLETLIPFIALVTVTLMILGERLNRTT